MGGEPMGAAEGREMREHTVADEIDHLADLHQQADTTQASLGKWLINALWLMHAGVIVGTLTKIDGLNAPPSYVGKLWFFVMGILFAYIAGAAAWANYAVRTASFLETRRRLINGSILEPHAGQSGRLRWTGGVGIGAALVSLLLLIVGGFAVLQGWKPNL